MQAQDDGRAPRARAGGPAGTAAGRTGHEGGERPLRVLLLAPRLLDTAGGRHCTDLALSLVRAGIEPVVCCFAGWGPLAAELERAGIEIFPLRLRPGLDPTYPLALAREMLRREIDVIHCLNARRAYVFGVLAGGLARIRVGVATFRDVPPHGSPWLRRAGRLCGEIVGTIVATSGEVEGALLRERWAPPGKTILIPDGVNVERFRESGRRAPARAHWGIPEEVPLIGALIAGREQAEQALLLQAFAEVRRSLPQAQMVICGPRGRGAGWIGLGPYTDSPAFFSAIDVLCIPSSRRVVPLHLLEALAATVPVAACRAPEDEGRAPAGPWAFADLTAPGPVALARGILELLEDRDAARALVREGATCIRQDHSIEPHVRRVISLYR